MSALSGRFRPEGALGSGYHRQLALKKLNPGADTTDNWLSKELIPFFAHEYRLACSGEHDPFIATNERRRKIAVLVSGHARTMVEPHVVSAYAAAMKGHNASVEVFAYIDAGQVDSPGCWRAAGTPWGTPYSTCAKHVEEAVKAWSVPFTLRLHGRRDGATTSSEHLPTDEARCQKLDVSVTCGRRGGSGSRHHQAARHVRVLVNCSTQFLEQFTKLEAATVMMEEAERTRGIRFDVVLRVRPDLCIERAAALLRTVLAKAGRCEREVTTWHDVMAVYPRWAARAYASVWRTDQLCEPPAPWLAASAVSNASRCSVQPWRSRGHAACGRGLYQHLGALGIRASSVLGSRCAPSSADSSCIERLALRRPSWRPAPNLGRRLAGVEAGRCDYLA